VLTIRNATFDDIGVLVDLNADVQSLHAELEPSHFKARADVEKVTSFFGDVLKKSGHEMLLACLDERPVGYIWFEYQERPETPFTLPRRRIYIHHVAVAESVRRQGVASALVETVDKAARASGVHRIILDAWASNEVARSFFATKGFAAFNLVLGKALE
jgi:GNAT superfamily N-acetyltransferase